MDITLSISLLASDGRSSLERCLDSLKPLLVKVPCELIVVLTGTAKSTKSIAEKYTPRVVSFPWRDDFSAARNAGLKEACGEWFLYLDDDEWFEDTEEICNFFLSGEYKRYQSAHYIQRNYLDWNGTKYSDFSAFRMVKRLPGTQFQNPVHEELSPRKGPCKYFRAYVHHYGYIKESESKSFNRNVAKISRNISLLLQSVHEEPSFVKNYLQLAKEYDLEGDRKKAEEYCRRGREVCRSSGDTLSKGWLQAYLSHLLCEEQGKRQSIEEIEEIIQKEHPLELIRLVLYQQLIYLYKEDQEPEKAVQYGLKFEKLLVEMNRRENLWEKQAYGEFNESYVKNPERLYNRRIDCIACALGSQDRENTKYFLRLLPWQEEDLLRRYYPVFEGWRETYGHPFTSVLLEIFENLNVDSGPAGQSTVGDPDIPEDSGPVYVLMIRALDLFEKSQKKAAQCLYIRCMEQAGDSYLQQILLCGALRDQIGLSPLAIHMDLDTWDVCAGKAVASLPPTLTGEIRNFTDGSLKDYPIHSLSLKKWIVQQRLLKGFLLWDGLTLALKEYCQCILEFYRSQYRDEMFDERSRRFLPDECGFAMAALSAMERMEQGQPVEAVRLFRECIRLYPPMTGAVNELLRQAMRRAGDPALHSGAEFRQLAGQMKGTLHTLLGAGQTIQAAEILDQLLPLMPEDTDLIRMRLELMGG